jgi:predicted nuclease of predicted toxin-antitoxin system
VNWPTGKTSSQREILLDENLPRKLVAALRAESHEVESIHTLKLQGLENGKLYEFARDSFDFCFTRDAGFANNVRQGAPLSRLKLLRVTLRQKPQEDFVQDFISAFCGTDWTQFSHGDDWPHSSDGAS